MHITFKVILPAMNLDPDQLASDQYLDIMFL